MSFDHWISWLAAITRFFVHRLYVRLLSSENHVFQGLDTLTPTLTVGNGLKMVSHVLVMFSVLCTLSWVVALWVVAVFFSLAAKTVSFFIFMNKNSNFLRSKLYIKSFLHTTSLLLLPLFKIKWITCLSSIVGDYRGSSKILNCTLRLWKL